MGDVKTKPTSGFLVVPAFNDGEPKHITGDYVLTRDEMMDLVLALCCKVNVRRVDVLDYARNVTMIVYPSHCVKSRPDPLPFLYEVHHKGEFVSAHTDYPEALGVADHLNEAYNSNEYAVRNVKFCPRCRQTHEGVTCGR